MAEFPEYNRQETIQPGSSTPNFSGAMLEVGQATWGSLSQIGATVAQSASTTIAQKRGYEMGQTPHGDLLPPLTDFDKQVTESYNAQSSATLGLQANQMMMDASVEMSKASRLTPELIAKTQNNMAQGLSQILENAPTDIKGKLGYTFQSQLMSQTNDYQLKMISQQRDDQKNNLLAALAQNNDTAFELAAKGDIKGAQQLVENSKGIADAGPANNLFSKEQAYVSKKSIEESALHGKYINQALQAKNAGKFEEWEAKFAKSKPKDLDYKQWNSVGNAVTSYMGTLENMRSQDESLRVARMNTAIFEDVKGITGSMLQELKDNVRPEMYEKTYLHYLKSYDAQKSDSNDANIGIAGWHNPEVYTRLNAKGKNSAFTQQVEALVNPQAPYRPIPLDEAETRIAASAAGPVPAFINSLNSKMGSGDPVQMESAGKQLKTMMDMGRGFNLSGVSDESRAAYNNYLNLRKYKPAVDAAQEAVNNTFNQKFEDKAIVSDNWKVAADSIKTTGNLPFYSKLGGFNSDEIVDPSGYVSQASTLLENHFKSTKGDMEAAKQMTEEDLKSAYGETYINGKKQIAFYPLEQIVNLPKNSAPFIKNDIYEQLNKDFETTKDAFVNGKSLDYWAIEKASAPYNENANIIPDESSSGKTLIEQIGEATFREKQNDSLVIHHYWKNGTRETFNVSVKANPWLSKSNNPNNPYMGGWDIGIATKSGWRPLNLSNPTMSNLVYRPNVKKIQSEYAKVYSPKDK